MKSRHIALVYPNPASLADGVFLAQQLIVGLVEERVINSGCLLAWTDRGQGEYSQALARCSAILWQGSDPPGEAEAGLPVFTSITALRQFLLQAQSGEPAPPSQTARRRDPSVDTIGEIETALAVFVGRGIKKREASRLKAALARFYTVFPELDPRASA